MIICRYQRSREKQDDIQRETYGDVEPEDRVVVVVSRFLQVGNRRDESRVLQGSGYQGENGNHGYHTIIAWSQQSAEYDAKHQADDLHRPIVHRAPKETFSCFFL